MGLGAMKCVLSTVNSRNSDPLSLMTFTGGSTVYGVMTESMIIIIIQERLQIRLNRLQICAMLRPGRLPTFPRGAAMVCGCRLWKQKTSSAPKSVLWSRSSLHVLPLWQPRCENCDRCSGNRPRQPTEERNVTPGRARAMTKGTRLRRWRVGLVWPGGRPGIT